MMNQIEPTVRRFVDRVRAEMPVKAAYLFGSHARGEAHENSDIDVAVVSSAFSGNRFDDNVRLGRLRFDIDLRIEPWGFRPEEFNEDEMMPSEILRTGIRIYPPDPDQPTTPAPREGTVKHGD